MIECEGCRQIVKDDFNAHECPTMRNEKLFNGILLVIAVILILFLTLNAMAQTSTPIPPVCPEHVISWAEAFRDVGLTVCGIFAFIFLLIAMG